MNIFFDSWASLGRAFIIAIFAYAGLVIFLRVSGKRTLAKLNAFDLVVTVALGSTLATALLSKGTALIDGLFAFVLLILLQYLVTWGSLRSNLFRKLVRSEPSLVFFRGDFLDEKLWEQRLLREEVLAAIRNQGILNLGQVEAVILETDGSFSVVSKSESSRGKNTLAGITTRATDALLKSKQKIKDQ